MGRAIGWLNRLLDRAGDTWIGVAAVANVIGFFQDPSRNPIHTVTAPWDSLWAIMYGVGGVLLLVSFAVRQPASNVEAGGWALVAAGGVVQVFVFATLGVATLQGTWGTVVLLSALVAIAVHRILAIRRAGRIADVRDRA